MTLPFSDRVTSTYTTDGVLKEFNFDFRVFFNVDSGSYGLEVRRIIEGGYEVISPSLYTVIPNEGMISGKIVFALAPESGQEIYISGKTPTVQQLNLTNYGRYNAEALETNFDFIVAICQEFISKIDEETRQRINADDVLKNNLNAMFESLATDIDARFNGKWTEIADYLNRTLPMFFCIMRKEIDAYAQTGLIDVINSELNNRGLSELIDEYINSLDGSFLTNTKYFSGAFEFDPDFIASGGKYPLNSKLKLTNGDVVQSLIPNNTNNPNLDMTGWENQKEKQKLKNSEFVTVQDFMLMKDIEDCKQPIPQYDHSYAILAFFAYIQNNKVVKAEVSGNFNLSQPLVLTNPATDAINFNAKIFAIGSGSDSVTFNQCNHVRPSGKFMVTTEATLFSGKKWNRGVVFQSSSAMQCSWYLRASGFKHWNIDLGDAGNNNSISLGTVRTQYGGSGTSQRSLTGVTQVNTTVSTFTYTQDLDNENYRNAGFIVAGGIYYPVISHDVATKTIVSTLLPSVFTTVQVVGFHVSRSFTARTDNPTSATPTQRSNITLNQGVDLPPQFERSDYVVIDDEPYRIFGYNPTTLELSIYPRIKDYSKTSGLVHFSFGGGVRLNGSDTNLVSIGKLSLTGNAIGVSNNNFYCTSIENAGTEFNIIGIGMGVSTTGVTKNNSSRNCYFEGNIFNVVDASADTGVNVIENPIAWDFNKFKRLVPLGSTASPVTIYSKTGVVVVEDGVTYRRQLGFYDGTNSATTVLSLGVQGIQNVRGSTNTVVLADDKSKRNLYGYTDIFFNVTGIRNNGTSDGATITIRSQDGYTINGIAGDFVMYGARNALLVHAKLVSGSNWQVSVFKASYLPVLKTLTIPAIATGSSYSVITPLTNAQMGDIVKISASVDLQGMVLSANVSSIGNIRIVIQNLTGAAINLGSVNFECSLER